MTVNLSNNGLREIVNSFDLFYIDIWGVLHNGIKLNGDAVNVLSQLDKLGKEYVLLTNAPRPNSDVVKFLEKLGLDNDWSLRIIKQVGNYGESYKRNIQDTGILPGTRGPNALWTQGGILYVPPLR